MICFHVLLFKFLNVIDSTKSKFVTLWSVTEVRDANEMTLFSNHIQLYTKLLQALCIKITLLLQIVEQEA